MNKDQISQIREELGASNPDLSQDRLSDTQIEAAAERVSRKIDQQPAQQGQADSVKPVEKVLAPSSGMVGEVPSVELDPTKLDNKDIMNAVLADLQGSGQNARVDNPDLANYVNQVLKMPRKE